MIEKEITVFYDPIEDDRFELVATDPAIGHVIKHETIDQTERGSIKDRLCPCIYCDKKDKIRVETRCRYAVYQPTEFYRIRCKRLICRIKDLFDTHFDESCDLDDLIKDWNGRYEAKMRGRKWRKIE